MTVRDLSVVELWIVSREDESGPPPPRREFLTFDAMLILISRGEKLFL